MNIPVDGSMIPGLSPAKFAEYQKHAENLIRHGGELRWKAGSPGGRGGEIFALVRDAGSGGQQVMAQASKLALGSVWKLAVPADHRIARNMAAISHMLRKFSTNFS